MSSPKKMNAIEILSDLEGALEVTRKNGCETLLTEDGCKRMHDAITKKKFTRKQLSKLKSFLKEMHKTNVEEAPKIKQAISNVNGFREYAINARTFLLSTEEWTDDYQKNYEREMEKSQQDLQRFTTSYYNNVVNGVNIMKLITVTMEHGHE